VLELGAIKKAIFVLIIIAVIAVGVVFLAANNVDEKKEAENVKAIFTKHDVDFESNDFLSDLGLLNNETLESIKQELESSKKVLFFEKPEKISGKIDILVGITSLVIEVKKYDDLDSQILAGFTDPCGQIQTAKERNNAEENIIQLTETLIQQINEYSTKFGEGLEVELPQDIANLKEKNQAHKDGIIELEALCK